MQDGYGYYDPQTPASHASVKRTRGTAASGNPRGKKKQRQSRTSNPAVSIVPASSCGVGPSRLPTSGRSRISPSPTLSDSELPRLDLAPAHITLLPDAERASSQKNHNSSAAAATDVYFFVRPLKSDVQPSVLPEPGLPEVNDSQPVDRLLFEKPAKEYTHLGCRLCTCVMSSPSFNFGL